MISFDSQPMCNNLSLLLVDDDRLILTTLSSGLKRAGYNVSVAESVNEAEIWLESNERPDLVILDVRMPERDGFQLIDRLDKLNFIPFILLTAYSEQEVIKQASATGAKGYLVKPVDIAQLIPTIETAVSNSNTLRDLRESKQQLQTALDSSRAISVAVGIVMDQHLIGHDDALDLLRKTARSKHLKLLELASSIVNSRENLNLRNSM